MDFVTKLDSAKHTLTAFANAAQRRHEENYNAFVAGYLESAMAYAMANMSDEMFADEMERLNKTIKRLKT